MTEPLSKLPALAIRSMILNSIVGFEAGWGILSRFGKFRSIYLCTLLISRAEIERSRPGLDNGYV